MPINRETLNKRLYKALRRYDAKPVDDTDEVIPLEDEADAFRFNFTKDGENYGLVYATLDDTKSLTIWFDDTIMDSPSRPTPGMDYNDTFTGFLKYMKKWALDNQLTFGTDNRHHLGNEMARRKRMKEKEKISEGYYPIGKKASYSDAVPNVKIVLQHTKVMQEGEQRFRHIEKIFVENTQGERFLVPTTKPGLARVFARHIAEGGTPYDERAGHIQSLVEEYSKMAGFVRATRNGQFNESAQQLVQEGINHYVSLRESLGKMTGHRGYTAYFENWTPALMEDDSESNNINELFVQETLDPRIESVMPILNRLHKKVSEMKEVDALSEWADEIISEKMVMGADSDASASGTIFVEDDIDEATDLTSIPDESVEEGKPGLWANIHAKRERIKKGSGERMRKPGSKGAPSAQDFKDSQKTSKNEGLGDFAKKVGGGAKKVVKKVIDFISPDDDEQLRRLQQSAGIQAQHGKPSMAHSEVEKRVDEEEVEESGLQAYLGNKKYGEKGMDALRKAGREHASKEKMAQIRAKYDKLDEEEMDEGLDPVKKGRLYDLIELYRDATEPNDYYDRDIEDPEEIIANIRKEFGDKIANQVESGADKMHFGRHDIQRSDPLGWKKPVDRITKAGKMYKQDSDYMKNTIKSRYKNSGKSATEGVAEDQLDELSKDTIRNYVKAQPARIKGPSGLATTNPKKAARIVDTEKGDIRRALTKLKDPAYGQQGVAEGGGMPFRGVGGAFNRGDDERHDLDPTDWYFVKDGKMFAVSVYPNQEQEAISRGYSRTRDEAKAKAGQQGVAEDLDANQKRVGQLGPTEKVKNNNIGKLVGANENFINMAPQAVAEGQEDLDAILRIIRK